MVFIIGLDTGGGMVKSFLIITCCIITSSVFAADVGNIGTTNSNLIGLSFVQNQFEDIKSQVYALNPLLVTAVSSQPESEQLAIFRGYLAEMAFNIYLSQYKEDIQNNGMRQNRTVRTLHKTTQNDTTTLTADLFWLDRGALDTNECKTDGMISCKYPDGFAEYSISYIERISNDNPGHWTKELNIDQDIPDENKSISVMIALSSNQTSADNKTDKYAYYADIFLNITEQVENYDEKQLYRNTRADDIRNGNYTINTTDTGQITSITGDSNYVSQDVLLKGLEYFDSISAK